MSNQFMTSISENQLAEWNPMPHQTSPNFSSIAENSTLSNEIFIWYQISENNMRISPPSHSTILTFLYHSVMRMITQGALPPKVIRSDSVTRKHSSWWQAYHVSSRVKLIETFNWSHLLRHPSGKLQTIWIDFPACA